MYPSPTITNLGVTLINNSQNMSQRLDLFKRGVTLIVNTFIAPDRQRVRQPARFCDLRRSSYQWLEAITATVMAALIN